MPSAPQGKRDTKDRTHFAPWPEDMKVINELTGLLHAGTTMETVRRVMRAMLIMIHHIEDGGEIVLCKKGQPDRVVLFV